MADESDDRVSELLRRVGRAEAPPDFEFKLRARLAQSAPRRPFSWWPVVATSFGAVAIAVSLLFVLRPFSGAGDLTAKLPEDTVTKPAVVEVKETDPLPVTSGVPESFPPSQSTDGKFASNSTTSVKSVDKELAIAGNRRSPKDRGGDDRREKSAPNTRDEAISGSRDFSSTGERAIAPVGVGTPRTETREPRTATYPVREALELSGITGDFSGGRWRVASVRSGSSAEISGIRPNDVIETIDGLALDGEFVITTTFNVRKMTVRRNGQAIEINLRNASPK